MKHFSIRKVIITFMTFAIFALCIPTCHALADNEALQQSASVGITIGEEGKRCFYYSEPNERIDNIVGFYYPGSKVYILDKDNAWYHISYETDGYIKAEDLAVLQGVDQIHSIGYAFTSYDDNDSDIVGPDGFVEFRVDCDLEKPGDPMASGEAFELIGYAGDMLQVKRGAIYGFIPRNLACVITLQDLFFTKEDSKTYGSGSYRSDTSIPSGLYQVRATETAGALILAKDTGEQISYALEDVLNTHYTIFIPKQVNVYIPSGCCLYQVTSKQSEDNLHEEGRYLCGVDFAGWPNKTYEVTALDTEDAYYIISNLFDDQTMDEGTTYRLSPGESRNLDILPGEFIEIHDCVVEEKRVPG